MATAAAGPGGMMSPEYNQAYRDAQAVGEQRRIAGARLRNVEDSIDRIERYKTSTSRSAPRRLKKEQDNLERIRRDVGASSTSETALNRAIRKKYVTDTR